MNEHSPLFDYSSFQGAWSDIHEMRSSDALLAAPAGTNIVIFFF